MQQQNFVVVHFSGNLPREKSSKKVSSLGSRLQILLVEGLNLALDPC